MVLKDLNLNLSHLNSMIRDIKKSQFAEFNLFWVQFPAACGEIRSGVLILRPLAAE
jgi:hypothetical protein